MLRKIYIGLSALSLVCFGGASLNGLEMGHAQQEFVPADVRHSPGGYRSFHFWHSGYRGGK